MNRPADSFSASIYLKLGWMRGIACPINLAVNAGPPNVGTSVHYKQKNIRIKSNIKSHINNKIQREQGFLCFLRSTSHEAKHGTLQLLLHCGWTGGCCPKSKPCLQRLAVATRFYCVLPGSRQTGDDGDVLWFIGEQINCCWQSTGKAVGRSHSADGEKRPQWVAHLITCLTL
jgi:hypothetical protein